MSAAIDRESIVRHYERVAPMLAAAFPSAPLGWFAYATSYAQRGVYRDTDASLGAVALSSTSLPRLAATANAIEFVSTLPQPRRPSAPSFGHVVLRPGAAANGDRVIAAARRLRQALVRRGLDAFCVLDGCRSLSLWIPSVGVVSYLAVCDSIRYVVEDVVRSEPHLFADAALPSEWGDRIFLERRWNRPDGSFLLPYSLRATPALEVVCPVTWDELGAVWNGGVRIDTLPSRLARVGDVFPDLVRGAAESVSERAWFSTGMLYPHLRHEHTLADSETARPPSVRAAVLHVADALRSERNGLGAAQVRASAVTRGLLPPSVTEGYVEDVLSDDASESEIRRSVSAAERRESTAERADAIANLIASLCTPPAADGASARERACCDAFAAIGFVTRAVVDDPDAIAVLDAPLTQDGYRTIVLRPGRGGEAETARRKLESFYAAYGAVRAIEMQPRAPIDADRADSLRERGIGAWTFADLATVLRANLGPAALAAAFGPGCAAPAIADAGAARTASRAPLSGLARDAWACGWAAQVRLAIANAPGASLPFEEGELIELLAERVARVEPSRTLSRAGAVAALTELAGAGLLRIEEATYRRALVLAQPPDDRLDRATIATCEACQPPDVDPDEIYNALVYRQLAAASGLPGDAAMEIVIHIDSDIQCDGLSEIPERFGPVTRKAIEAFAFLGMDDVSAIFAELVKVAPDADLVDELARYDADRARTDDEREAIAALEQRYVEACERLSIDDAFKATMAKNRDAFTRMTRGHYALVKKAWS